MSCNAAQSSYLVFGQSRAGNEMLFLVSSSNSMFTPEQTVPNSPACSIAPKPFTLLELKSLDLPDMLRLINQPAIHLCDALTGFLNQACSLSAAPRHCKCAA